MNVDALKNKHTGKKLRDKDYYLSDEYLEKLKIIESGALNGEIIDKTEHFELFFPSIHNFLIRAVEESRAIDKTLNMENIDAGIEVPDELGNEKAAIKNISPYYNAIDTRSGRDWRNVMPVTLLPAVLGAFGAVLINPNLVTSKYGGRASELEIRIVKSLAKILGFKDLSKVGGLSVEGGTKGNMYGYLLGLRKAFPDIKEKGLMSIKQEFKFINSLGGHFSNFTNLSAIGVGTDSAIRCPVNRDGAIRIPRFKEILEDLFKRGVVVPTILITMGTTDGSAIDDIKEIHDILEELLEKYPDAHRPHLHVDAAIGWAFAFFNDYDGNENPLKLSKAFLSKIFDVQRKFKYLDYADSIAIDLQKTGFCPYSSSFVLVKNNDDFKYLAWKSDVFKYFDPSKFEISPVVYSLECTRSPVGVFSTAMALNTLGIEGYQILLAAGMQHIELLRSKFQELGNIGVINENLGFAALFRPYPSFVENGSEIIDREFNDPNFLEQSKIISEYERGLFEYWTRHKDPETPILDHVEAASCTQYDDNANDIPSWKAYMLNPRSGYFLEAFWKEFLHLRREYEQVLPEEFMSKLKEIFAQ